MKKIIVAFCLGIMFLSTVQAQLKVLYDGTVQVPARKFMLADWVNLKSEIGGCCGQIILYPDLDWYMQIGKDNFKVGSFLAHDMRAYHYYSWSDASLKTNLKRIENPIENLFKISGYIYNFVPEVYQHLPEKVQEQYAKPQYGFVAQQIAEVYPELVEKSEETGLLSVNYQAFIPLLLEAVKQQQKIADAQSLKIKELEKQLATKQDVQQSDSPKNLGGETISLTPGAMSSNADAQFAHAFLYQNTPNPFTENTEIRYFLPQNTGTALLCILDLQGAMKKQIPLNVKGTVSSVTLHGNNLVAGMYVYSLICDGQIVDTKRMILTK